MFEQAVSPTLGQSAGSLNAMSKAMRYTESWQTVLIEQDAQLIWERLYGLMEKIVSDEMTRLMRTQELFLQLLAQGIDRYIEEEMTDRDIEEDLISRLAAL